LRRNLKVTMARAFRQRSIEWRNGRLMRADGAAQYYCSAEFIAWRERWSSQREVSFCAATAQAKAMPAPQFARLGKSDEP
jgi:hypothetical protein